MKTLQEHSASGATDYIVASHLEKLSLLRLKNGAVLDVNDVCAIGNQVPMQDLIDRHLDDSSD